MATDKIPGIELPSGVTLTKGQGGLPVVQVKTARSTAEIYLHGAHVTHFQKTGDAPLLWMSQKSKFDEVSAIRGGIPVIFPWFGGREGSPGAWFCAGQELGVESGGDRERS